MVRWWTTERISPESAALRVTFWQSLAAYRWACQWAVGRVVLDVGCGTGYGAAELAQVARHVIALDADHSTLRTAQRRYGCNRITWLRARAEQLPVGNQRVDLVCCFQVLEHLEEPEKFLQDAYRVLIPGGIFVLTTPNHHAIVSGLNPHHTREYDAESLRVLLANTFQHSTVLGVYPSPAVRQYRAANRRLVTRIVQLDRWNFYQRLPIQLREPLHTLSTFLVRLWLNRQHRNLVTQISAKDFTVQAGDLRDAIDLVGVGWRTSTNKNPLDELLLQD